MAAKTMWVAMVDDWAFMQANVPAAYVLPVEIIETDRQYRVANRQNPHMAQRALGFRQRINKSENKCLYETREEAIEALRAEMAKRCSQALRKLKLAEDNLYAVEQLQKAGEAV